MGFSLNFRNSAMIVIVASLLFGCTNDGTIFKKTKLGSQGVLSVDARQRIVLTGKNSQTGHDVYCAEPSPDAIVAQATALAASLRASQPAFGPLPAQTGGTQQGTDAINAAIASSLSETAGNIGLRTQSIQLMRDGYYRLCEALVNGQIGPHEYRDIVGGIDTFVLTMQAIEQVGGNIVAQGNVVVNASNQTVSANSDDNPDVNIQSQGDGQTAPENGITIDTADASGEVALHRSRAVVDIMRAFYDLKRDQLKGDIRRGDPQHARYISDKYYNQPVRSAEPKVVKYKSSN